MCVCVLCHLDGEVDSAHEDSNIGSDQRSISSHCSTLVWEGLVTLIWLPGEHTLTQCLPRSDKYRISLPVFLTTLLKPSLKVRCTTKHAFQHTTCELDNGNLCSSLHKEEQPFSFQVAISTSIQHKVTTKHCGHNLLLTCFSLGAASVELMAFTSTSCYTHKQC